MLFQNLNRKLSLKRKTNQDPVDVVKKRKPEQIINNDSISKALNENIVLESSSSILSPKRRKSTAIKFDESVKENSPLKPKISPFRGIENTFTGILKFTEKSLKQKKLNFASINFKNREETDDVELTFCEDLEKEQVKDLKHKNNKPNETHQYDELPTTSERTRIADARRKLLHEDANKQKNNVPENQKHNVIKEEKITPKRVYHSCNLFSDSDSDHSFSSIVCLETPAEEIYSIEDQTNDAIECDLVSRLEEQL